MNDFALRDKLTTPGLTGDAEMLRKAARMLSSIHQYGYQPNTAMPINRHIREWLTEYSGEAKQSGPGPFMRRCSRCGKEVHSTQPLTATVVYCSLDCAD